MKNIFAVLCVAVLFAGCGDLTSPRGNSVDNTCAANDAAGGDIACVEKDCDDGIPCTYDAFNWDTCECDHKSLPGCKACKPFAGSSECDDSNPCTTDSCELATPTDNVGRCEYKPIAGCTNVTPPCEAQKCAANEYCNLNTGDCISCDDKDPCTDDKYNFGKQRCENSPRICENMYFCQVKVEDPEQGGCDVMDCEGGCDDHDPCTEDACWSDGTKSQCGHNPHCLDHACVVNEGKPVCEIKEQCVGWWNCDDHDPCTSDYCLPQTSLCFYVRKSCGPNGTCMVQGSKAVCDYGE